MSGLEHDRGNDSPIPNQKPEESEKYAYYHQPNGAQSSQIPMASEAGPPSKRFYGLQSTTLILSIPLTVVTVLAVVGAGVGGSLAAKGGHCNASTPTQPITSSVPQVSDNFSNPTTNSTSQATNATTSTLPTSDCDKLGKTYVSAIGTHTEFNVYCNSDLSGADFLSVFVYFFKDCIEACASFNFYQTNNGTGTANVTCYRLAFALVSHEDPQTLGGNCFLKGASGITATHRDYTSAASLIQS